MSDVPKLLRDLDIWLGVRMTRSLDRKLTCLSRTISRGLSNEKMCWITSAGRFIVGAFKLLGV